MADTALSTRSDEDDAAVRLLTAALPRSVTTTRDRLWNEHRAAWNTAVDQHPLAVVRPRDAAEVAEALRIAEKAGVRIAPQSTGHAAAVLGDLSATILLGTDRLDELTVDVAGRTVRAGAGVEWQTVASALAPHGLAALAGSSGDVGIAGYLLGGGLSWFAREHGLACSHVTALDVVTGAGDELRVDADHHPDLFWALRGGLGNAAVVTAFEFDVFAINRVYAGALLFDIRRASEVLRAWSAWIRDQPEEVTTCARLLRLPPLPELPEMLRGRAFVAVDGAINLPQGRAEELLQPLRDLQPDIDLFTMMPASQLGQIHMDPPQPVPGCLDGALLDGLADDTIDALLAVVGADTECPLLAVDLRQLGGAVGRPQPNGGSIEHLPGRCALYAVGLALNADALAATQRWLDRLMAALAPWSLHRLYPNFVDAPRAADRFYPRETLERLREVRRTYDPDHLIRPGQDWSLEADEHAPAR